MKATATLRLHIDIDEARDMGMEIDNPEEYAIEEMIEWIYSMTKTNDIQECIHIEIDEESK